MRFRKLRITWSVGCGIVAVLLIALWVRSYSYHDSLVIPQIYSSHSLDISSLGGRVGVHLLPSPQSPQWWKSVKNQVIFVPGRGYTVPGVSGYFDGDGKMMQFGFAQPPAKGNVHFTSLPKSPIESPYLSAVGQVANRWGFGFVSDQGRYVGVVPSWFSVLTVVTLATAPWLRWRFGLRTLLIATTLLAVLLGLIVWSAW